MLTPTKSWRNSDWDFAWDGDLEVRPFALQFAGKLHSDQTSDRARRLRELQEIRRALHPQLMEAWRLAPVLRQVSQHKWHGLPYRGEKIVRADGSEMRPDGHWVKAERGGLNFIPLVIRAAQVSMVCELDIWIGWREKRQGGIVRDSDDGFDIDSRLKGLLDALAVPQANAVPPSISEDPNPCLVLLENDNLITRLTIKADPLRKPPFPNEDPAYVEINIDVQIHSDELGEEL